MFLFVFRMQRLFAKKRRKSGWKKCVDNDKLNSAVYGNELATGGGFYSHCILYRADDLLQKNSVLREKYELCARKIEIKSFGALSELETVEL